jgi:TPR repeat protein
MTRMLLGVPWALLLLVSVANACPPDKSPLEDIQCLHETAEQGDALSQYLLGSAYFDGDKTPRNYEEAAKWFRRAANQGDKQSQFELGLMYFLGKGVPKNIVLSEMWFILYAVQGQGPAGQVRDRTEQEMTPAQIAEAQKLAREWKPKPER